MLDGFYAPLYKLDSVVIKSISIAMISGVVFLYDVPFAFYVFRGGGNGKAGTV